MDNRFNTIAGWVLFSSVVALGLTSVSSHYFQADKNHRPETMGHEIEGVESSDGGDAAVPLANLLAEADVSRGEQVFRKCASCHTNNPGGANGIGPNTYGVMGEAVASPSRNFAFSDALKKVGGSWDFQKMNDWLHNPRKFAPGTKMTFAGLPSAEDRAAILVYMNSQGSNLPLPAPETLPETGAPAEGAPTDGAAAEGAPTDGAATDDASAATDGAAPAPGGATATLPIAQPSPQVGDNKAVGTVR